MTKEKEKIRVRIAPSPTGSLHIGTARTALFNWLFAKHHKGTFVLRIEDTDMERSDPKFEAEIIEGLKWLGIDWDEGPFRQSERLDIYEKYLKKLLEEKRAYYCYCTKEELEHERQGMLALGMPPKYGGKCRNLAVPSIASAKDGEEAPDKPAQVIRFRVAEAPVEFKDTIRGSVTFDAGLFGDIAIAKNLRTPLYNFAVVIDDYEMEISHVIRGEDHISNTPKQILLQKALGFPTPHYAHLPLILAPNRSKLSKRYAETSLLLYRDQGYLPEALVNFIAYLGWHPKDDKEILDADGLVEEFDIRRVQKGGAVFNEEKLDWLNAQYIKQSSDEDLAGKLAPFLAEKNWGSDKGRLLKVIALQKERMVKLSDFIGLADFFFDLPDYAPELLVWQKETKEKALENLLAVSDALHDAKTGTLDTESAQELLMPLAEARGRGGVLWPLRVALSGKAASPNPFEILGVLGRDEAMRRITVAIQKLK